MSHKESDYDNQNLRTYMDQGSKNAWHYSIIVCSYLGQDEVTTAHVYLYIPTCWTEPLTVKRVIFCYSLLRVGLSSVQSKRQGKEWQSNNSNATNITGNLA